MPIRNRRSGARVTLAAALALALAPAIGCSAGPNVTLLPSRPDAGHDAGPAPAVDAHTVDVRPGDATRRMDALHHPDVTSPIDVATHDAGLFDAGTDAAIDSGHDAACPGFAGPFVIPTENYADDDGLLVGDLNGDGLADIVSIGALGQTFHDAAFADMVHGAYSVLLSKGDGSFAVSGTPPGKSVWLSAPALVDVDGDGRLDLLAIATETTMDEDVFTYSGAVVRLGTGLGTFGSPGPALPSNPSFGAGVLPVLTPFFAPDGTLSLATMVLPSPDAGPLAALTLVTAGRSDASLNSSFSVPAVPPSGGFASGGTLVAGMFHPGGQDFFIGTEQGTFYDITTTAQVVVREPTAWQLSDTFQPCCLTPTIADVNHDGLSDLVCGCGQQLDVYLAKGDGSFKAPIASATMTFSSTGDGVSDYPVLADFDGDGDLDVALLTSRGGPPFSVGVMHGRGDGHFRMPVSVFVQATNGFGLGPIATGDLNGDGEPDLVVGQMQEVIPMGLGYDPSSMGSVVVLLNTCARGG